MDWLQLGVAGAALFVLYKFGNRFFSYLEKKNTSEVTGSNKIDRLCDKIDELVQSNNTLSKNIAESSVAAAKDNSGIQDILAKIFTLICDVQLRTVMIDERTRQCNGDYSQLCEQNKK